MDIIASRRHFEVTNKDIVMYNGACYQLMTQKYLAHDGGMYHLSYDATPKIPNSRAEKLIREGKLIQFTTQKSQYSNLPLKYYRFNVEGAEK